MVSLSLRRARKQVWEMQRRGWAKDIFAHYIQVHLLLDTSSSWVKTSLYSFFYFYYLVQCLVHAQCNV